MGYNIRKIKGFKTEDGKIVAKENLYISMKNPGWISKVVWDDGTESWAKSWTRWDEYRSEHLLARVGIGSHGQWTVWTDQRGWCHDRQRQMG